MYPCESLTIQDSGRDHGRPSTLRVSREPHEDEHEGGDDGHYYSGNGDPQSHAALCPRSVPVHGSDVTRPTREDQSHWPYKDNNNNAE